MVYRKLALSLILSGALVGCGGDDGGSGDVPLGGDCGSDGDCAEGVCEPAGNFCTITGDSAVGCTSDTCPSGFTCVLWGSSGEPPCPSCPPNAPRPLCLQQAGSCADDTGSGASQTYVVSVLNIGQAGEGDQSIVPGFNLDGRTSDGMDEYGCFHEDSTSPPPDNEQGVDNQLGPALGEIGGSFDIEGTIATNIADGDLLILVTVSGIDDFTNDPCVTVNLELGTLEGTGETAPMQEAGLLVPGQTFNVDARSVGLVESQGEIIDGRLSAGPVDVELELPVMDMTLTLNIRQALLRFDVNETAVSAGLLGGALGVEETVTAIVNVAPDDIPEGIARNVLESQADLQPAYDPELMGLACQAVSVGLVYEGVSAVRGDVVTPTM